jgi:hypothetical protein
MICHGQQLSKEECAVREVSHFVALLRQVNEFRLLQYEVEYEEQSPLM